jgi:hypothetical protein
MKPPTSSVPLARILAGETYLDVEARRRVLVVEEVLDRSGSAPCRTDHFRVIAADGPEKGRASIVPGSSLVLPDPAAPAASPRGGPPRPMATVLPAALARVGAAALPHCETDEERAIASALAECATTGGDALRELARLLLVTSVPRQNEKGSP